MNWNALYHRLRAAAPSLELRRDEPMSRHTSFQVGGPVPIMALPKDEDEVQQLISAAVQEGARPFFMGRGTNLLVSDGGADLLVIKAYDGLNRLELLEEGEWPGHQTILAGSGVSLARLARFALEHGLTGLEFAHGIPGSVGGGVYMNAGAYGGEMGQVVSSVSSLTFAEEPPPQPREGERFSYRHSVYQEQPDTIILRACFSLRPGDRLEIKAKMDDLTRRRSSRQPLEYPSAGSTFKRPAPVDGQPVYAAALIDGCGLKGLTVGGAQVSEKHAGFVINRGGAVCDDIVKLMAQVRERVFRETGITLEPEVRYLGKEGEGWNF